MVGRHTGCHVDADSRLPMFSSSCFLGASLWRFSGHVHLEETLCQTQKSLQGLCILSDLEIPQEELESVAADEKDIMVCLLDHLPL